MKKISKLLWIDLLYIISLMIFKLKNKNIINDNLWIVIILVILIIINIVILLINHFINKHEKNKKINIGLGDVNCNIESRKPEHKTSNDELLSLISEYKKNNKPGEQK